MAKTPKSNPNIRPAVATRQTYTADEVSQITGIPIYEVRIELKNLAAEKSPGVFDFGKNGKTFVKLSRMHPMVQPTSNKKDNLERPETYTKEEAALIFGVYWSTLHIWLLINHGINSFDSNGRVSYWYEDLRKVLGHDPCLWVPDVPIKTVPVSAEVSELPYGNVLMPGSTRLITSLTVHELRLVITEITRNIVTAEW